MALALGGVLARFCPGLDGGLRSTDEKVQDREKPGPLSALSCGEDEKTELKKLVGLGRDGRTLESRFRASAPVDPDRFCLLPRETSSKAFLGCCFGGGATSG
jgi:hypothetical protein